MNKFKEIVSFCGSVIAAMDYTPAFAGTTVKDTLRLATKSVLELDRLIDEMPKVVYCEECKALHTDDLLVFIEEWHEWQKKVTECRRADDAAMGFVPHE